jgi:hypothetical protein
VDAFGLVVPAGIADDPHADRAAARHELERELLAVLPAPVVPKKVSEAS